MKILLKITNITIIALFIWVSINQIKTKSQLHPNSHNQLEKILILYKQPQTSNNGQPLGNNRGAGSSGSLCQFSPTEQNSKIKPLIALVPVTKIDIENKFIVLGNTTLTNPTFFFYVAYPVNSYGELVIQDAQGNEIYSSQNFPVEATPGIVTVTIPQILEVGKDYRWYFRIRCNPESSPDDFVSGVISRVPELSADLLQGKTALKKVIIYAENSLWFDALIELENLKNQQHNDKILTQIWRDLLTQVGFSELTNESVVQRQIFE